MKFIKVVFCFSIAFLLTQCQKKECINENYVLFNYSEIDEIINSELNIDLEHIYGEVLGELERADSSGLKPWEYDCENHLFKELKPFKDSTALYFFIDDILKTIKDVNSNDSKEVRLVKEDLKRKKANAFFHAYGFFYTSPHLFAKFTLKKTGLSKCETARIIVLKCLFLSLSGANQSGGINHTVPGNI